MLDKVKKYLNDQYKNKNISRTFISNNEIEIYYMYACLSKKEGKALMIFNVDKVDVAEEVIEKII